MPAEPSEDDLRVSTPVGTPPDVLRALLPIVEGSGDREVHLVVRLHYPGMGIETAARAIELFAAEVIPGLKTASSR